LGHDLNKLFAALPIARLTAGRVGKRDPGFAREVLNCADEINPLDFLNEGENVTRRPAPETLVSAGFVAHIE
jgi:hypothetical protein